MMQEKFIWIIIFATQVIFYFIIVFILITYLFFWLNSRKERGKKPERFFPKINFFTFLKIITIEFICILSHILLLPFVNIKVKINQKIGENKYPVLLIPGYMENQTDWWYLISVLQYNGITRIYTINLKPVFASIEEHAILVNNEIQRIKVETKQSKIILIGHSRGGLVASYCSEKFANQDIDRVITLGTPFKGATAAMLGFEKNAKQMLPNSNFIKKLSSAVRHSKIPYYCMASKIDNLVYPWTSSITPIHSPGLLHVFLVDNVGHIGLLKSLTTITKLIHWLKEVK